MPADHPRRQDHHGTDGLLALGDRHQHPCQLLLSIASFAAGARLEELLGLARVKTETLVLVEADVAAAVSRSSRDAALVFIGLDPPEPGDAAAWHAEVGRLLDGLGDVVLVSNAGGVELGA